MLAEICCSSVKDFHDKFELHTPESFSLLPDDLLQFRHRFLQEELNEYLDGYKLRDLATTIDSLLDLVYVTCGAALLHGISPQRFAELERNLPLSRENSEVRAYSSDEPVPSAVGFLSPLDSDRFFSEADLLVAQYLAVNEAQDQIGVELVLVNLYRSCIAAARGMGFDEPRWLLLWNEVQRANMTKERTRRAEDSKRGSKWDVIKPAGWTPPDIEGKLAAIIREAA